MPPRDPGVAAVLSFLLCGLGQIYNGQIAKGLFMMLGLGALIGATMLVLTAGSVLGVLTGICALGLWVYGIVDGKDTALKSHDRWQESD